jgi:hypothetical protein
MPDIYLPELLESLHVLVQSEQRRAAAPRSALRRLSAHSLAEWPAAVVAAVLRGDAWLSARSVAT